MDFDIFSPTLGRTFLGALGMDLESPTSGRTFLGALRILEVEQLNSYSSLVLHDNVRIELSK